MEELGEREVLSLCLEALNCIGAVVTEAHRFFGLDVESMEMELDMVRTQTLLETDVDPFLIAKWHWDDAV